jgi:hypothetical protein
MASRVITERTANALAASKVDRAAGVIRSVLLCGTSSGNGRDYPPAAFGDAKQYEGRPAYLNHAKSGRAVQEQVGVWRNARLRRNGTPEADLHLYRSHPYAGWLMDIAESNPAGVGASHVALCDTRPANGREVVERISHVESVDIVDTPATTRGLHESLRGQPVISVKQLLGRLAARASVKHVVQLRRLCEMEDLVDLPVPEPAADTPVDDAVADAFKAAAYAVIDDLIEHSDDAAAVTAGLKKLKKLIASHGDVAGVDDTPGDTEDQPGDEKQVESVRRRLEALGSWDQSAGSLGSWDASGVVRESEGRPPLGRW